MFKITLKDTFEGGTLIEIGASINNKKNVLSGGLLIKIGALINKNTFEGGALIVRGVLIGRRVLYQIITVYQ